MNTSLGALLQEALFEFDIDHQYVVEKLRVQEFEVFLHDAIDVLFSDKRSPDMSRRVMDTIVDFEFGKVSSSELKTPICKQAHSVIPITITATFADDGSSVYGKDEIIIRYDLNSIVQMVTSKTRDDAENAIVRLTAISKSATIYHEMSHWVDDATHNQHLQKNLAARDKKVGDLMRKYASKDNTSKSIDSKISAKLDKYINGKYGNIIGNPIEINADMHTLKSVRNDIIKILGQHGWDRLDFSTVASFTGFDRRYYVVYTESGLKYADMFANAWIKRAVRENLLGQTTIQTYSATMKRLRDFDKTAVGGSSHS